MILRSFKLVNVCGAPEIQVRGLAPRAVHRIERPDDVPPRVVLDGLRFALFGDAPAEGELLSPDAGYAFAEMAFCLSGDAQASVFRGMDRRGKSQVSLREKGGLRVSGGEESVDARLSEALGPDHGAWAHAAFVPAATLSSTWLAEHLPGEPLSESLLVHPDENQDAAAQRTSETVEALRAALRADRLRLTAAQRHAQLLDEGCVLRRERTQVAIVSDEVAAQRERVRASLHAVEQYSAARLSAAAPIGSTATDAPPDAAAARDPVRTRAPRDNSFLACHWLLTTSMVSLLALVLVATAPTDEMRDPIVMGALGVAFLVAFLLFLGALGRREEGLGRLVIQAGDGARAARSGATRPIPSEVRDFRATTDELRESLRARFAEIEDPDDPTLTDSLRDRAGTLDRRLGDLRVHLERIDDLLALFDVEAGRAARALHLPLPEHDLAEQGLADQDTLRDAERRITDLGDAVYQATVERDALRASGAGDAVEMRRAAVAALREAAQAAERPGLVDQLAQRVEGYDAATTRDAADTALCDEVEAALTSVVASGPAAPETSAAAPNLSPTVVYATDGEFSSVQRDGEGGIRVERSAGGLVSWRDLPAQRRDRLALALRVRLGVEALPAAETAEGPDFVVLERAPDTLDDDAIANSVKAGAGRPLQVVVA